MATALELYVSGSLSYLNHSTNVNINNRVVCYDISVFSRIFSISGLSKRSFTFWVRLTFWSKGDAMKKKSDIYDRDDVGKGLRDTGKYLSFPAGAGPRHLAFHPRMSVDSSGVP